MLIDVEKKMAAIELISHRKITNAADYTVSINWKIQ